jgi:hypothetical protein
MSKKYDPLKGIKRTQGMLMTETVGYGVAGKISTLDTTGTAGKAFAVGSSLAGVPSLVSGASNVMDSLKMLDQSRKKKK